MERVTPVGHVVAMQSLMSFVGVGATVLLGLVLLAVGSFSLVTLMWGDLLERDPPARQAPHHWREAA